LAPPKPKNRPYSRINHPAIRMWRSYESALKLYYNIISSEWIRRGFKHNMGMFDIDESSLILPYWLGNENFHSRHRASLLYKNYDWYKQFGWTEEPKIDYVWP
jgi:hypothetical protein